MNKTKNRNKAPKNQSKKQNGFFRALFVGIFVCLISLIIFSLIFALVMSNMEDCHALGPVFSIAIAVVSLMLGGFASGKTDKSCAVLAAVLLGCAFLGIGYSVSSAFTLSKGMGSVMKTVNVIVMLVSPVLGAKFSVRNKTVKRPVRKRM